MRNLGKKVKNKIEMYRKRKNRTNMTIKSKTTNPRVVINKSNLYIKAQVVNNEGMVLASIVDKSFGGKTKTERSENAGLALAEKLLKIGTDVVSFDRNGNLYHGRVKAFADGLRKGGLKL